MRKFLWDHIYTYPYREHLPTLIDDTNVAFVFRQTRPRHKVVARRETDRLQQHRNGLRELQERAVESANR